MFGTPLFGSVPLDPLTGAMTGLTGIGALGPLLTVAVLLTLLLAGPIGSAIDAWVHRNPRPKAGA